MRHTIDLTPLYRSAIGFDRLASLLDAATVDKQPTYPPYNIELVEENRYRITMAVAGFAKDELEITAEDNTLLISGRQREEEPTRRFLHQGIAARSFERKFQLAEHVRVTSARLEHGLLHVELIREIPETLRPRRIPIGQGADSAPLLGSEDSQAA